MGDRTKIDWCDASWNPVTGCLHGCEYCYARRIAERFGSKMQQTSKDFPVLNEPVRCTDTYEYLREMGISEGAIQPYPFDFKPTFHRYRLDEPKHWKKPRNIFVCSMADLFGDWVPDEWIAEVFNACTAAPQHRYLFLTKNGKRYSDLVHKGILVQRDNFWYGSTITAPDALYWWSDKHHNFASVEPILEPFDYKELPPDEPPGPYPEWMIVGAETGNRKDKVIPKKDWLDGILEGRKRHGYAVFMKESLRELMGADFVQEFPWEVQP